MDRFFTVIMLGAMIVSGTMARAQSPAMANRPADLESATATGDFSALPALPGGKSTILGGEIRNVDPVLDEFTLRIVGQHPMKIYFDQRTQVFRNGTRIPLHELRPEEHASVQTVLDGSNVFAISIHMLSEMPEGESQGRVLSYDPATHQLIIGSSLSREPIRVLVREDTPVVRVGQNAFISASKGQGDLVNGALVSVKFDATGKGQAVASRVTVLAAPGSDFVFGGKLTALDMHAGRLVVVDPRDQQSYEISFNPAGMPVSQTLHIGDQVRVTASFDGTRYTATGIIPVPAPQP